MHYRDLYLDMAIELELQIRNRSPDRRLNLKQATPSCHNRPKVAIIQDCLINLRESHHNNSYSSSRKSNRHLWEHLQRSPVSCKWGSKPQILMLQTPRWLALRIFMFIRGARPLTIAIIQLNSKMGQNQKLLQWLCRNSPGLERHK